MRRAQVRPLGNADDLVIQRLVIALQQRQVGGGHVEHLLL